MNERCKNCGLCCLETEMALSEKDIERIMKNYPPEIKKKDFAILNDEGYYQLINIESRCYFFDEMNKSCRIYEFRPTGCKFYPLIFDHEINECIFDNTCPRPHLFYQNKKKKRKTCQKIRKFIEIDLKLEL